LATERQARDPEEAATAPPYGKAVTVSSAAGLKELGRRFGLRAAWPEPAPCAVCPLAGGGRGK
jgi:hypothetical protein